MAYQYKVTVFIIRPLSLIEMVGRLLSTPQKLCGNTEEISDSYG